MYYLVDIGNRYAHIYKNGILKNLEHSRFLEEFKNKKLFYISVKSSLSPLLKSNKNWINLTNFLDLKGSYKGMGTDRQVLLFAKNDGIYIDAGSAITIDKKINDTFVGGVILPGIWSFKKAYSDISPILNIDEIVDVDLNILPKNNTKETISYGIIAPIVALVEKMNTEGLNVYITGGDGELLSKYIKNSAYKKDLIFDGMKNILRRVDANSCFAKR